MKRNHFDKKKYEIKASNYYLELTFRFRADSNQRNLYFAI